MNSDNDKRNIVLLLLVAFILFLAIIFLAYRLLFANQAIEGKGDAVNVEEVKGERFAGLDDFYHATGGTWKVETVVHILKEQKYVSSDVELKAYLVYEAKPGEIVRMKESSGRWKLLEVVEDDAVIAKGWADVDKDRAERL